MTGGQLETILYNALKAMVLPIRHRGAVADRRQQAGAERVVPRQHLCSRHHGGQRSRPQRQTPHRHSGAMGDDPPDSSHQGHGHPLPPVGDDNHPQRAGHQGAFRVAQDGL